jgi:hypothetical protein
MKILRACAYLCLCFSSCVLADDLIGVVKSISGEPLPGVFIYSRSQKQMIPREHSNPSPFQTTTDKDGRFRLTEYGGVLFLRKPGYKPLAKRVDLLDKKIEVFLDVAHPQKSVPNCALNRRSEVLKLDKVRLSFDSGYIIEKHKSADSLYIAIRGKEKPDNKILSILLGTTVSIGFPSEELILNSVTYQLNSLDVGSSMWVSAIGNLSTGERWRFLGNSTTVISYEAASNEEAILFDRVIDSLCIEQ